MTPVINLELLERSVVGGCLFNQDTLAEMIQSLDSEHFDCPSARLAFMEIKRLFKNKEEINLPSVASSMAKNHGYSVNEAASLLMDCSETNAKVGTRNCVQPLQERLMRKKLHDLGVRIQSMANDQKCSPIDLINKAKESIASIEVNRSCAIVDSSASMSNHDSGKSFEEILKHRVEAYKKGEPEFPGIPYGITKLDRATGGIRKGSLNIIGGRTSMGKTEFALFLVNHWRLNGHKIGIFSLEMPIAQLDTRLIAQLSQVSVKKIEQGCLSDEEVLRVEEACEKHRKNPVFYDAGGKITPSQIEARMYGMKHRLGIQIVMIDFLTLISPEVDAPTTHEKYAIIIKSLQRIAQNLEMSIVLLAQLNRECAKEKRRPTLYDIRECGAVEEALDIALFLHRRDYYDPMDKPGEVEVILEKNRHNGDRGIVPMSFDREKCKFSEIIWE